MTGVGPRQAVGARPFDAVSADTTAMDLGPNQVGRGVAKGAGQAGFDGDAAEARCPAMRAGCGEASA